MRTVREKAINLTGERRVDRIWGDVIRYLVLVDWLMIVATIVRRPGWSTIQLFHESRCIVARFSHRQRIPATKFASFLFFSNLCRLLSFLQSYKCRYYTLFQMINNDNQKIIKYNNEQTTRNK